MTQPTEHYALAQLLLAAVFSPGPHFVVHLLVLIFMMNIQLLGGSASRTRTMRLDPRGSNPLHPKPSDTPVAPLYFYRAFPHLRTAMVDSLRFERRSSRVGHSLRYVRCRASVSESAARLRSQGPGCFSVPPVKPLFARLELRRSGELRAPLRNDVP